MERNQYQEEKLVACRWVFTIKHKADGTMESNKEEVYMIVPSGFSSQSIVGESNADHTMFVKRDKDKINVLIVYDDDIVARLVKEFKTKDLGPLYFLGIEVAKSTKGIFISQKYILDLLDGQVRICDSSSLYALCRSWLRNGFPEENQPQYVDGVKSLPKPSPALVADCHSPVKKEGDKQDEEVVPLVEPASQEDNKCPVSYKWWCLRGAGFPWVGERTSMEAGRIMSP
ncbi:hypothetical protein CsSME_00011859 [Camellia sinensis var. sinensis]